MTARQAAAPGDSRKSAGNRMRNIATLTVALVFALLVAAGIIHTFFPDLLTGEGRAARKYVLANSEDLARNAVERAFARSSIEQADLLSITSAAPESFNFKSCSHNYRTQHRSVWKCRFELHVEQPFEVHITDVVEVHLSKNISIPGMFIEEPQIISAETEHYPRVVETFGVVPDADR